MRPIKFRAWDEDGHMVYPYQIGFNENGEVVASYKENNKIIFGVVGSSLSDLMQFTGLYDKNGKEIWEGDIIKICELKERPYGLPDVYASREVIFENGGFAIETAEDKTCPYELLGWIFRTDWRNGIEVIGNIYENPELLK